jgi:large subunit ribosomal protein L34e
MPRPALRSRAFRRVKKKLPGGAFIIHYLKRKPSVAKCSSCGKKLHGIASERPSVLKKMSRTKKTTSRPYGGKLCSRCTKNKMKERVR